MQEFTGPKLYAAFYIVAFVAAYFVTYKLMFFALRDLIKDEEGALGKMNCVIGVAVGFFKGLAVVFVAIYIFDSLLNRNVLTELKPYAGDSMFYGIIKFILDETGLLFF